MLRDISVQFSSVTQSCPTLWDPVNHSTPGLPVHHQLPEFTQTHVHRVSDAIQPSHPLLSPSPPALNPSQHQSFPMSQLFAWGSQSTGGKERRKRRESGDRLTVGLLSRWNKLSAVSLTNALFVLISQHIPLEKIRFFLLFYLGLRKEDWVC